MVDVIRELVASFNKEEWRKALENANLADRVRFNKRSIEEVKKILKKKGEK